MNDDAARMVEVGGKDVSDRVAVASCVLEADAGTIERLVEGTTKGDPIEAARIAGLMAVKRTPDLLPFCHPVAITGAEVVVRPDPGAGRVTVTVTVRARDRGGDGGHDGGGRGRALPLRRGQGVPTVRSHRGSPPGREAWRRGRRFPRPLMLRLPPSSRG
jgi:molybdenum cofactor biosynthesis protein MoaC